MIKKKIMPQQLQPIEHSKYLPRSVLHNQDSKISLHKNDNQLDQIHNIKAIQYMEQDSLKNTYIKGKREVVETDKLFVKSIKSICEHRTNVLHQIIGSKKFQLSQEECEEIHYRAKLHRDANTISTNNVLSKQHLKQNQALKSLFCKCGCDRFKGQPHPLCHNLQELSFIGSGILLFFTLMKGLILSTGIMFFAYSIYALYIYSQGNQYIVNPPTNATNCTSAFCQFKDRFSSYNKLDPNSTFLILDWVGLGAMMAWIIISRFVKEYGFYQNQIIDADLQSSSDFAVKIDNLPAGGYSQQELVDFFQQQYARKVKELRDEGIVQEHRQTLVQGLFAQNEQIKEGSENKMSEEEKVTSSKKILKQKQKEQNSKVRKLEKEQIDSLFINDKKQDFQIKSVQIIYKMEFSRKIVEKIINSSLQINHQLNQVQGDFIVNNKDNYLRKKKDIIEVYQTLQDLRKKYLNDSAFRQKIATHSAIVQFKQEIDRVKVDHSIGRQNLTLYKKIRESFISCLKGKSTVMFKGQIPNIVRAPQPSDIQWQNCQKQFSFLRILAIFIVAFAVIMISLGIIAGVQAGQVAITNSSNSAQPSVILTVLNVLASLVLVIVNAILWILLQFLLDYQYNYTKTNKITSLVGKACFAMWINIIVVPIVVNYVIYDRYYGVDGVAGMVVDYQIAALAASLPLKLFNPLELVIGIALKIKCIRHWIIRLKYRKKSDQLKIQKDEMKYIYQFYDPPEFIIEQYYVFILPNIMQAIFFCQLQPVLLLFAFAQTFLFYWVCKIRLLKICKIPDLLDKLVFESVIYLVMLAPIFYGVGSIYNSYVSHRLNSTINFSFVPAAICIGLGVLNYFNPCDIFQKMVKALMCCLPCLRTEYVYANLKKSVDQNENDNKRIQSYYNKSNSLTLLGFQSAIRGDMKNREVQFQLKKFCQSHVGNHTQSSQDSDEQNDSQFYKEKEMIVRKEKTHHAGFFD